MELSKKPVVDKDGVEVVGIRNQPCFIAVAINREDKNKCIEFPLVELEPIFVPAHDKALIPTDSTGCRQMDEIEKGSFVVVTIPRIDIEMVEQGFRDGVISLAKNPNTGCGTVCQIGYLWFHIPTKRADWWRGAGLLSPERYLQATDESDIVREIYDALTDESFPMIEYVYCARMLNHETESRLVSLVRLVNDLVTRRILGQDEDKRFVRIYMADLDPLKMDPPVTEGWVNRRLAEVAWDLAWKRNELDKMRSTLEDVGFRVVLTDTGNYEKLEPIGGTADGE